MALAVIAVSLLFFIGHGLGWVFEKTKIPDLLILIIIGYTLGPVLGFLTQESFGKAGDLLSTLALVVILYEGGLHLTAKDLAASFSRSLVLSFLTFFSIALLGFCIAYLVAGQPLMLSLLFGVGIGSTSSAVVIPLVKPLSISNRTKTLLSLESAITDVLAIVIFIVIADGAAKGHISPTELLKGIGPDTLISSFIGIGSGLIWASLKKRFSYVFKMLFAGEAYALLTYGILEHFGFNGAIGVLALGFTLANLHLLPQWLLAQTSAIPVSYRDLSLLKELTFMLKTFFFIYLGVLVSFSKLTPVLIAICVAVLILITRYLVVKLLFRSDKFSKLDSMVTTIMGPRGLACAVLATIPAQKGLEGAEWLQSTIFALIPITILLTAVFVALFENKKTRSTFSGLWDQPSEDDVSSAKQDNQF